MGGTDETTNLVDLTAREHFVAHQLLVKMNPGNHKLAIAVVFMSRNAPTNRRYGWIRTAMAEAMRGKSTGRKGIPCSPEHKARLSEALRGNKHTLGMKFPPMSAERRVMAGNARRGKKASAETLAKMSAAMKGNKYAVGNKIWVGRKHTPETKAKMAEIYRQRHLRRLNGSLAIPVT